MEMQTAKQINGQMTGESAFTPNPSAEEHRIKDYLPAQVKHPLRFSINGVMDKIPDLKKTIEDSDLDVGLKTFLCSELDKMKSNAAEIHLHDVERSDGGFDLHVSLKSITLGAKPNQIFKKPMGADKSDPVTIS